MMRERNGTLDGMKISKETEVLREGLPQRHFVHHSSHVNGPEIWATVWMYKFNRRYDLFMVVSFIFILFYIFSQILVR
jgi:hypothetical protein